MDVLIELLLQGLLELLWELWSLRSRTTGDTRRSLDPVVASLGLLIVGGAAGGLMTWVLPARLLPAPPIPGASMIALPLLNGGIMHVYGAWQVRRGRRPSAIATFWGGALFAFGFAAIRFMVTGRQ